MKVIFSSRLFDGVAGGVERMSIAMMNELVARGHQVELVSLDRAGATTFYPLDPAVTWHRLDIGDANRRATRGEVLARLRKLRGIVRRARPDVGIGFQQGAYFSLAVASFGLGVPIIAAERNAPHRFDHLKDGGGRRFQFESFRLAARVTVQMDGYRQHYPPHVQRRIVSISNPVPLPATLADPAGHEATRKRLLSVARLSFQKNQTLLIGGFAKVAARFADWDLVLAGGGEDRAKLEALAAELGLSDRVLFLGPVEDVGREYLASHLFCLTSRWEGFPNALAEAMSYGLPAVGLAACAGINELIAPDETGLLAGAGEDALADALAELMGDAPRREAMGRAARRAVLGYAPEKIFDRWEALFQSLARRT